ncbi:MAG: saccharopine dehydrogenase C-terminal domain-containing protein [Candidatus Methanomethylicia archaeon]
MDDVVLIGFGNIGRAVVFDLVKSNIHPLVVDVDNEKLKIASREFGLETLNLDVSNPLLIDRLKGFNVAITALPGAIAYRVLNNLLNLGINVVDVSYFPESPWSLDPIAREKNVVLILDAGFAPGLTNILLGYFHSMYGGLNIGRIYVGGISLDSTVPLGLVLTWSVEDLIDEYIRPARAILNGSEVNLDPLSNTGEIEIPGVGVFEYFVSDGIRTMLKTFNGSSELIEYTLRYKGHLEIMRSLKKIGLLSYDSLNIDGVKIKMNILTAKILNKIMVRNVPDRVVMYIEAFSNSNIHRKFIMDLCYDFNLNITAMAKTTGFTQSSIAKMVIDNIIVDKGLLPPEFIGINLKYFEVFKRLIDDRGLKFLELP